MLSNKQKGFSLVEMVVVLAIFSIITGVVIANIPKLRNKTSIDLVAQSMALHIRGAQVYGIGTRQINRSGVGETPKSFGIHFDHSKPKQFLLFADTTANKEYDGNFDCAGQNNDECVEIYNLKNISLESILDDEKSLINEPIDIVYTRPSSEANFCKSGNCGNSYSHIAIELVNIDGDSRLIEVWRNGQIAVKKPNDE